MWLLQSRCFVVSIDQPSISTPAPVIAAVSAPRKAWRIWSGESPGMERVNHPPLPSVAHLAERCSGKESGSFVYNRGEAYTGYVAGRLGSQPLRAGIASKGRSGLVSVVTCVKPKRTGRIGKPGESRRSSQATACNKRCVVNAGDPCRSWSETAGIQGIQLLRHE